MIAINNYAGRCEKEAAADARCPMKNECGICEYEGEFANAPSFLCETCADAIRRLLWIREREQQASETPLSLSGTETRSTQTSAAF
jgi:hypothetical protein